MVAIFLFTKKLKLVFFCFNPGLFHIAYRVNGLQICFWGRVYALLSVQIKNIEIYIYWIGKAEWFKKRKAPS